ncbi:hypothetical protein EDB92DRAFT_2050849 [Lactarius akahatsu]|uniref:Phorbol-ester/DAG-type domain-containing protein n=1 Tax=Lactarius akahatsu TaxID=416441 RepID=A0AAD4LSQ0_9AGAM|nr:hypothetical protein EDB92DRAFT_2050849 [Lactarius akahatsu]
MSSQREKLSVPVLRLQISEALDIQSSISPSDGLSESPSFREKDRASLRPPQGTVGSGPSPHLSPASTARDESQKLLAHVLEQLRHRPKPLSPHSLPSQAIPVANTSRTNSVNQQPDLDGEDDSERAFSPDLAFDLMNRLRDVLMISLSHRWQLFNDNTPATVFGGGDDSAIPASPFRRRRRSASIDARHLSYSRIESTELLSQCIFVLQSIVSEDCRYSLSPPRPSRPPNSLQALSLDIALLLVHMHAKSDTVISQVGFALLPAFTTFKAEMYPRLILFFEGILRDMLHEEMHLRSLVTGSAEISSDQGYSSELQADGDPQAIVSIQVESYEETHPSSQEGTQSPAPRSLYANLCVPSQGTPGQSLTSYRLLSLLSPLLAAISDAVDFSKVSSFTVHRLRRLFDTIVDLRLDTPLNVLEVVAYHTHRARPTALGLLQSYWPRALGHCLVSKPFETLIDAGAAPSYRPYAHQFVLWRFEEHSGPTLFDGNIWRECRSCLKQIVGLGLLCPFCVCAVHFDCYDYPDGNLLTQYPMKLDPGTQRVAVHRFCHIQPPRSDRKFVLHTLDHIFRVVNTFTLALCFICNLPLWGFHSQGLKCDSCNHFAHARCIIAPTEVEVPLCLTVPLTSAHMTISPRNLRNSFRSHFESLLELDPDSLRHREEIMICSDVLWSQLQILRNGLALGSVVIEGGDKASESFNLELSSLLDRFRAISLSQTSILSDLLSDYFQESRSPSRTTLLFDWSTLVFFVSSTKLVDETPDTFARDTRDSHLHSYDVVPLGILRDRLATHFQIRLDVAVEMLLGQLHHVGLFELPQIRSIEPGEWLRYQESLCLFSLPLSLDLSVNVETLVTAIEACLSDIDLSVNEAGFLFLIRRAWPTGMSTNYALRRLMKSVFCWILTEDEKLATILRDYIPFGRELPGVRTSGTHQPWPSPEKKPSFAASSINGGDYRSRHKSLLRSYAAPWLLAVHDQDTVFYGKTCFELVVEIAEDTPGTEVGEEMVNLSLRHITRLCQAFVVFTTFDDLFLLWLESTSNRPLNKPIVTLQRLLNRESNMNHRSNSAVDFTASLADASNITAINPWGVVLNLASTDKEGLGRCLQWLSVFALSAVDIPEAVFQRFKTLTDRFEFSVAEMYPLVHAAFLCVWMKSLGRQELYSTISSVHLRLSSDVSRSLGERTVSRTTSDFIRLSLAACLLLAGCARGVLVSNDLVMESEVHTLPSRRTVNTRASMVADPIHVNTSFVRALGDYVNVGFGEINVVIAKFFYLFVNECSLMEAYEVDNFILRNAGVLTSCIWSFYEMQSSHLFSICPNILMRILVVDSQPLDSLLQTSLSSATHWETRLRTLKQLFRMILDVTNPSFVIGDRQWQSSATIIFHSYFTALWQDPQEEVKVAVDTWSRTLLPAHFEAITNCWNEALVKAPASERLGLINFLIKLQSLFSSWRVLSWEVIIGVLSEDEDMPSGEGHKNRLMSVRASEMDRSSAAVDPDVASFHISILLLSLKMIGSGISIDLPALLKLKKHLVRILGFSNISTVRAPGSHLFYVAFDHARTTAYDVSPCMDELLTVLDASHPFPLVASAMTESLPPNDAPASLLVGSIFVDIPVALITGSEDLLDLPTLTTKRLIECLLLVMYKHDMESLPLRHLQGNLRRAVRRVLNLVPTEFSYELRQLALTVAQTYVKLWPNTAGSFVLECIEACSEVIVDVKSSKEDPISSQATAFIETALLMFAENGIMIALFKRTRTENFFKVLRTCTENKTRSSPESQGLRDILLRDTASRIVENDPESFKLVMHNLSLFIEKVHTGAYDPGLVRHIGLCLTGVVRRTADWSAESFDPSPLLLITSILIENNPTQTRDFLVYADTILRAVLIRFIINQPSLVRILEVAKHLHVRIRKQTAPTDFRLEHNRIMSTILESYGEGLRRKSRISPSTLAAMAEAIAQTSINTIEYDKDLEGSIAKLGADGIAYLQTRALQGGNAEAEVNVSLSIAKLVLHGLEIDGEPIHQLFLEQPPEKSARLLSIHVWNVLLLTALSHKFTRSGVLLMGHFPTFVIAYREALTVSSSAIQGLVSAAANINHCYASVKLWLLLDGMLSQDPGSPDGRAAVPKAGPFVIWNELWPPFSDLISAHEADVPRGQNMPLWSATSSVIADLFHFLREIHSILTLETAVHEAILTRLRVPGQPEGSNTKLARTLRIIREPTPRTPWITLLDQVKRDIITAEKLDMLESRDLNRVANLEKYRRDSRAV